MLSIPQLRAAVEHFDTSGDERARRSRESTLALLEQGTRALSRDNFSPGHLTASAVVLSRSRLETVLVYHRKLQRWLQPGGHMEPADESSESAAARELMEETGLVADPRHGATMVSIDVHEIPPWKSEPAHLHHDVVWCLQVPDAATLVAGAEWCRVSDLAERGVDHPLQQAVRRALALH